MDPCAICNKAEKDEVEYGTFWEQLDIRAHFFCLVLSTHLPRHEQNGKLQFLDTDIKKAIYDCRQRVCIYCKETHASIKCAKCPNYFHQICGLSSNCLFEFVDPFQSYCHEHYNISHTLELRDSDICTVCREPMGEYNPLTSIMASCCNCGWAHRHCMKQYALKTGYNFKCPWCTKETNKQFRNEARKLGMFVPDLNPVYEMDESMEKQKGYKSVDTI